MVTADELDPAKPLRVMTRVNGEVRQDDTTDRLTWGFAWLINYISTFATLKPGDLIWTGTPTGAGVHRNPPVWLKPGDVVEVELPQIGVLRNKVADESKGGSSFTCAGREPSPLTAHKKQNGRSAGRSGRKLAARWRAAQCTSSVTLPSFERPCA